MERGISFSKFYREEKEGIFINYLPYILRRGILFFEGEGCVVAHPSWEIFPEGVRKVGQRGAGGWGDPGPARVRKVPQRIDRQSAPGFPGVMEARVKRWGKSPPLLPRGMEARQTPSAEIPRRLLEPPNVQAGGERKGLGYNLSLRSITTKTEPGLPPSPDFYYIILYAYTPRKKHPTRFSLLP